MPRLRVCTKAQRDEYEIIIGRNVLSSSGASARRWLGKEARKIALISNSTVLGYYGQEVLDSLKASGFDVSQQVVGDGERFKSLKTIEQVLAFLSERDLQRSDGIVAFGGGVIGDLAGFAAAVYLRGISFVYLPTTLLAQIDSSVGGKTGVNLVRGKNLVGAFHQPAGVLSDLKTLHTLPKREIVSGACELVKQSVISSRRLFNQTMNVLQSLNQNLDTLSSADFESLIAAHCSFKASVVSNDERESLNRNDNRSRRILNFGHTVGHAIESLTGYRRFRHGEAVGIGMLVAGELSKNLGLLSASELDLLTEAIDLCGRLPKTSDLSADEILNSLHHDKKSVAGNIHWVLLEGIGHPRIMSGEKIKPRVLQESLREGLKKATKLRK